MNLEDWTSMVKRIGSQKTRSEIKNIIKSECLFSQKRIMGAYQINGDAVWNRLIICDTACQEGLKENRIKGWIDMESWAAQIKHQKEWRYWNHVYRKFRR